MVLSAVITVAGAMSSYADDRAPTADEQAKIESALKGAGYVSWQKIELEDGKKWEVDDARHSDGKTYDLDLSLDPIAVTNRKLD
jgi:Peptidase propeptide and YPEB domain